MTTNEIYLQALTEYEENHWQSLNDDDQKEVDRLINLHKWAIETAKELKEGKKKGAKWQMVKEQ